MGLLGHKAGFSHVPFSTVGFLGGPVVKSPPASAGDTGDTGSIPELGRTPGRVMGTYSSIIAWKIPWIEEPEGLRSMGSQSQTRLSTYTAFSII